MNSNYDQNNQLKKKNIRIHLSHQSSPSKFGEKTDSRGHFGVGFRRSKSSVGQTFYPIGERAHLFDEALMGACGNFQKHSLYDLFMKRLISFDNYLNFYNLIIKGKGKVGDIR